MKVAHAYQEIGIQFCEPRAAQLHIYHTMRGLQQAGHQVALLGLQARHVLCTEDLGIFGDTQVTAAHFCQLGLSGSAMFKLVESGVRRWQSLARFPYLALFDSFRMLDAGTRNLQGFDLIHERFNLLGLGGAWASRRLGIPYILEVNADLLAQRQYKGTPEKGLRRLFAVWATRQSFNAAARIICISPALKEHLVHKWQVKESKLAVLPVAADVAAFGREYDTAQVKQRLGLTHEPVVMWVGGFFPWHDLDLLLAAFAKVRLRHPAARLLLVGDGPTRPQIEKQIVDRRLQPAVILTGAILHTRVPEIVSIADVTVVPSTQVKASQGGTGTPLKLFEYMAAGKAIVATALDQAADAIEDGQTGRLVAAGDVGGFAEAVNDLLDDADERSRLGQNARRQAVERYSWEAYTRRLEAIYAEVLGEAGAGAASVS